MISITNTGNVKSYTNTVLPPDKAENAQSVIRAANETDVKAEVQKYSSELSIKYGVTIVFDEVKNKGQIVNHAQKIQSRYSVTISEETLYSIMSDPEKRAELEGLLKNFKELYMTGRVNNEAADKAGIIINACGETSVWELEVKDTRQEEKEKMERLIEHMQEITRQNREANKKQAEEAKKKKKNTLFTYSQKNNFSPRSSMLRIARANSVPSTKKIISSLYAQRYTLKSGGTSSKETAALERTIDYVIQKARTKINGLEKEQLAKLRIKKAEVQKQVRRAAMMAHNLKKQRTARKSREYGQAIAFYGPDGIIHYARRARQDDDEYNYGESSDYMADMAVPVSAAAPVPALQPEAQVAFQAVNVDVMNTPSGTLSVFTMPSIDVSV